jgi:hypothetical protein
MSDEVKFCPVCKGPLEYFATKCPSCGESLAPPIKALEQSAPELSGISIKMVEPEPLLEAPPIEAQRSNEMRLRMAEPEALQAAEIPPPLPIESPANAVENLELPPIISEAPVERKKSQNYIARHWRGELPLVKTYWVNGVLLTFSILLAMRGLQQMQDSMSLKTIAGLSVLVSTLIVIVSIWQFVGIWRSSTNYVCEGGANHWGVLAKVAVVLGMLNFVAVFFMTYIPQSTEMIRIMVGDTKIPAYEINVMYQTNGAEVEFRGGLRAGCAKDLEHTLSQVARVKVLHIESTGGRLNEARRMAELVRKYNLITYTSTHCMSAATLVLIAGKERVVAAGARGGFHSGTLPGITADQKQEMNETMRTSMKAAGVSEKFIQHVLATPPKDMWYPTVAEMMKEGVITSETYGDRFAATWAHATKNLDATIAGLSKIPGFKAIQQYEPEVYAKMIKDFTTGLRSGKSEGEAAAAIMEQCEAVMTKYVPSASDESLLGLQAQWVGILKKYGQKNSRTCVAMFTKQKMNFSRAFPDWDMTNSLRTFEKIIISGAGRPPMKIDEARALSDIQTVKKPIIQKYGTDMSLLQTQSRWMDNSDQICDMLLIMYQGIGELPEKRAANLLRYLLSEKEEE